MVNIDPKVQRIIDWRESFVTLPDNHFFELIRMYLGEIHSPFNKQKLVEELGAFLRREENRRTIVNLLSETDVLILSAVRFIPDCTQEKLTGFFSGSFNFASLYERLLNLEERLLIYRHADKLSRKVFISINPTLEDTLFPFLTKAVLMPEPVPAKRNFDAPESISPEIIAAFIAYIHVNPDLCKADGTFKKRAAQSLNEIFGRRIEFFQLLINAFINLNLVKETPQGFEIDKNRLTVFSRLDPQLQYAYLCVSAYSRLGRTALVKQAKLLLDTINSIPEGGFTRNSILRKAFLLSQNQTGGSVSGGRFAAILNRARTEENQFSADENITALMDRIIDGALETGLLELYGLTENEEKIYCRGSVLTGLKTNFSDGNVPKVLNIDAGFTVMIFPGLSLLQLFPLMDFMDLKQFDTAATFEITRKSVMRAFDKGVKASEIEELINRYSLYQMPENLKFSIEDWSRSYSSAVLYKGYVLKVEKENALVTEKNPAIAPHIYAVLAPGVYLLSVKDDEEAEALIKESGLDYIGSIQTAEQQIEEAAFPVFQPEKIQIESQEMPALPSSDQERKEHFDFLRSELNKLNMSVEQKEGLLLRIDRKIVLTPGQLNADSVKLEQIEAGGMDFQGKIHVAESAITQNMMLELEFDDPSYPDGTVVIVGTPTGVEKNPLDAVVHMIVEPEREERTFSIGHAKNIKRMRGSVLK